jgi:hypothetical protein
VGLLVARDAHFALAVKAGDNGDSHNHNDVGNVIVYKNGRPVLIDVGVETYTRKTFSAVRYDIWTMQSAYHNLPTFEGVMQRDGAVFAAREVETTFEESYSLIGMEIADAYPPEAGAHTYRRTVALRKGYAVTILDSYYADKQATLSLMLAEEPTIEGDRIILAGLATIALEGAGAVTVETIPITDARLRRAWPEQLYRALVPLVGTDLRVTIE